MVGRRRRGKSAGHSLSLLDGIASSLGPMARSTRRRGYDGLVVEGYKHYWGSSQRQRIRQGTTTHQWHRVILELRQNPLGQTARHSLHRLLSHLKETEWRFNHRHDNLYQTLLKNLASYPLIQERTNNYFNEFLFL